jgi:hypothetical protein
MTTPSAGWYPDPTGGPGQTYWDGQQWHTGIVAPTPPAAAPTPWGQAPSYGQPVGPPKAPPWTTTKTMSLYSILIGIGGILADFLCGVGILLAVVGLVVGILAFNRAKKYSEPTGMAISGIALGCAGLVFGLLWVILFGAFFTGFSGSGT